MCLQQICSKSQKQGFWDGSCPGSARPIRACRARCLCLLACASFLWKIRCFRGNFLLPALRAHIVHMQAIWHSPAPHAEKGTGRSWAGRALEPSTNLPVGLQTPGPSPLLTFQQHREGLWLKSECPGALLGSGLLAMTHKPRMISGEKLPRGDAERLSVEVPLSQCGCGGSRGPHGCCAHPSFVQDLALDTTSPGFSVKLGERALLGVSQGFKKAPASEAM